MSRRRPAFLLTVLLAVAPAEGSAAAPTPAVRHQTPQTPAAPPLPRLDIDAYPPDARAQIGPAHEAATASPDDPDTVGRLALVLHAWDESEAAAASYARAQALAPANEDWWYLGALLASRRGLHAEAAGQFREAHTRQPGDVLIALRLADALLDAGRPGEAAPLYETLATRPEAAPAALYGLGRVRQLAGQAEAAREAYERAIALYPDFGAAHYALAQLQRRSGDTAAARASLQRQQQCLACWPMPPDVRRARLDTVREDAAALLQRGVTSAGRATEAETAEAIRLHEAAISRSPGLGQAHVNLIDLYARTGNLARAETHYASARVLPGYAAEAHRTWGWVLLRQRRPDEALPVLSEAVRLTPDNAQAQYGVAVSHELQGRPAEAAAAYARAVAAAPTDREMRFGHARVLLQLNRLDEAIVQLRQVLDPVDATTPRSLYALSVAFVRQGQVEEGRRHAQRALDLARQFDQQDLAAAIARDLARLPPAP